MIKLYAIAPECADRIQNIDVETDMIRQSIKDGEDYPMLRDSALFKIQEQAKSNNGIAVIDVVGPLEDKVSWLELKLGNCTSYEGIHDKISAAVKFGAKTIVFNIDSPGGTVLGLSQCGRAIKQWREEGIQFIAQVNHFCASAAYYLASCCDSIYADAGDYVGSIGTLWYDYDQSGKYEKMGVEPIVESTGKMKGMGIPGTEYTDEQREYIQNTYIAPAFEDFIQTVAAGRNITATSVKQYATGGMFDGKKALDLGLIDGLATMDNTLQSLTNKDRKMANIKQQTISENSVPTAATLKELKASFPKADNDFIVECMEKELPVADASREYIQRLEERNEALQKREMELIQTLETLKSSSLPSVPDQSQTISTPQSVVVSAAPGADPVSRTTDSVEPIAFKGGATMKQIAALASAPQYKNIPATEAYRIILTENPELATALCNEVRN